jgi:hypothetical protein
MTSNNERFITRFKISVVDPGPHKIERLDPDPDQIDRLDPDPDADQHQFADEAKM